MDGHRAMIQASTEKGSCLTSSVLAVLQLELPTFWAVSPSLNHWAPLSLSVGVGGIGHETYIIDTHMYLYPTRFVIGPHFVRIYLCQRDQSFKKVKQVCIFRISLGFYGLWILFVAFMSDKKWWSLDLAWSPAPWVTPDIRVCATANCLLCWDGM